MPCDTVAECPNQLGHVAPQNLGVQVWYQALKVPPRQRRGIGEVADSQRAAFTSAKEQRLSYVVARGVATKILHRSEEENGWVWLQKDKRGHHPGLYPVRREAEGHTQKGQRGSSSAEEAAVLLLNYCATKKVHWEDQLC